MSLIGNNMGRETCHHLHLTSVSVNCAEFHLMGEKVVGSFTGEVFTQRHRREVSRLNLNKSRLIAWVVGHGKKCSFGQEPSVQCITGNISTGQ